MNLSSGIFALLSIFALSAGAATPAAGEPQAVVARLYRDWGTNEKNPIFWQPPATLEKYFSAELAELFDADHKCAEGGDICNLEFDPLWDSQDPITSGPAIKRSPDSTDVTVLVRIQGPGKATAKLTFRMKSQPDGWRIDDIVYPDRGTLKEILRGEQ